jgi:hypothetical protein
MFGAFQQVSCTRGSNGVCNGHYAAVRGFNPDSAATATAKTAVLAMT